MPSEGPDSAMLSSSTFSGLLDYKQVLTEARELTEIMTGAMKVQQGPANLVLRNIVGIHADGTCEKFPPYGPAVSVRISARHVFTWIEKGQVKDTFEKSVVLFALRSANPYVREVLREFARSDDWVN